MCPVGASTVDHIVGRNLEIAMALHGMADDLPQAPLFEFVGLQAESPAFDKNAIAVYEECQAELDTVPIARARGHHVLELVVCKEVFDLRVLATAAGHSHAGSQRPFARLPQTSLCRRRVVLASLVRLT